MNSTSKDPWAVHPNDFPHTGTFYRKAAFLIGYAILAPSGHNTQPWQFVIKDNLVELLADRRRALPVVDPDDRELTISCGAALYMLEVAAHQFGYATTVTLMPKKTDPNLLARISFSVGTPPKEATTKHFEAIAHRRTSRAAFLPDVLDRGSITACEVLADTYGVGLTAVTNNAKRTEIAKLVAEGDRIQFDDPAFRQELAFWVHSSRSGSKDGMSGTSFGMPDVMSPVGSFVIRTFDIGDGIAAADEKKIITGTPMLGLLSSARDDQESWINTGRALSAILLELGTVGFTASYLNQPIEVEHLRKTLGQVIGIDEKPQILIRIGKAETIGAPTVRRAVSEVLREI